MISYVISTRQFTHNAWNNIKIYFFSYQIADQWSKGELARLFPVVPSDKRGNRHKLKHITSHLNRTVNFFTRRVIKHRSRSPRDVVDFLSSLEVFKPHVGNILSNLLLLGLLKQKSWTRWSRVLTSNINHSVILSFCDRVPPNAERLCRDFPSIINSHLIRYRPSKFFL